MASCRNVYRLTSWSRVRPLLSNDIGRFFLAAQRIVKRDICYDKLCSSVYRFVRLSIALVSHDYTVQGIETYFASHHRKMSSFLKRNFAILN